MDNLDNSKSTVAIVIGVLLLLLCCCALILAAVAVAIYDFSQQLPNTSNGPLLPLEPTSSTPEVVVTRPAVEDVPLDTLEALKQTIVPENDPQELACRLKGVCNIPESVTPPPAPRQVGEQDEFWVSNVETNENFRVTATLRYVTPHAYFWAENGLKVDEGDMKALVDTFENQIYPTDREFFGSEWTPGIDGDEHIYILYARGLGSTIAGYFSSADEIHPLAHKYSNAHEMFVFNADNSSLNEEYTYGVLAHEFQHMIHWYQDRNETSWLNEGFSELAVFLNGYDVGGKDWEYSTDPDLQLNIWPGPSSPEFGVHYGSSFLFVTYFLDRFGEQATQLLVKDAENGLESLDNVLKQLNSGKPGQPQTAEDFFMDWVLANYLKNGRVGDGRYTYTNYSRAPQTSPTEHIYECPSGVLGRTVKQYGVDYIQIKCEGNFTLRFEGSTVTGLLPEQPYSGKYAFWSNKGDESDMTLTREFDFTGVRAPIKFTFHTWYDLEKDYDYLYFEVSEDGQHWQILTTPSGRSEQADPSGNAYGWGYNDKSNGWIEETIDLSSYAGKKIYVRFEYVTDAAVNGEGMLIDDVRVDAINYFSDFETDDGGWSAEGFVRVQNALPQTFRLALVKQGASTTVEMIPLNPDQTAEIPLSIGGDVQSVTLVVCGTTRFTNEAASYTVEIR